MSVVFSLSSNVIVNRQKFKMIRSRRDKDRNPRYQAIIKIKGYPNKAQTFRTKKEAQQWEIKIKAAIQEGRYWDHSNAGNCPWNMQ